MSITCCAFDPRRRNATVPARTFDSLLAEHQVRSIGLLKVDTEGQEPAILEAVLSACAARPGVCPRALMWETTHATSATRAKLHAKLLGAGYLWARPWPMRDGYYVHVKRLEQPLLREVVGPA